MQKLQSITPITFENIALKLEELQNLAINLKLKLPNILQFERNGYFEMRISNEKDMGFPPSRKVKLDKILINNKLFKFDKKILHHLKNKFPEHVYTFPIINSLKDIVRWYKTGDEKFRLEVEYNDRHDLLFDYISYEFKTYRPKIDDKFSLLINRFQLEWIISSTKSLMEKFIMDHINNTEVPSSQNLHASNQNILEISPTTLKVESFKKLSNYKSGINRFFRYFKSRIDKLFWTIIGGIAIFLSLGILF